MEKETDLNNALETDPSTPHWEDSTRNEDHVRFFLNILTDELRKHDLEIDTNSKILDIGSGLGKFVEYLTNNGFDAVGVDFKPRNKNILRVVKARIEKLPFRDNSFDLTTCIAAFDHYVYEQDQLQMTSEVLRVLKPGAILAAVIFNDNPILDERFVILSTRAIKSDASLVILQKK